MSKELTPLEIWYLVKIYLNYYHHQSIKADVDVKTIEGHPIDIIEESLKAFQLIIDRRCDIRYVGFFIVSSHELPMSKEEVKFVEDILNERKLH